MSPQDEVTGKNELQTAGEKNSMAAVWSRSMTSPHAVEYPEKPEPSAPQAAVNLTRQSLKKPPMRH